MILSDQFAGSEASRRRLQGVQLFDDRDAVFLRHQDVGDDEIVDRLALERLETDKAVRRLVDLMALLLEENP